ncbi:MAG TPA: SEL1-like repeat protein [Candidatus Limnocylindria bacterium]|jgi:hypothetical protein|nr:SEL1-like repeat protein [Candidatus Limnocylindria bacterium]
MKTLSLTLALFTLALAAPAGRAESLFFKNGFVTYNSGLLDSRDRSEKITGAACTFPFRKIGDQTIDLVPLFRYYELKPAGPRPLPEWELLVGRILQVSAGAGSLFTIDTGRRRGENVFIAGDAFEGLSDGIGYSLFARENGTYSYESTDHAKRTVKRYEFGEILLGDEAEPMFLKYQKEAQVAAEEKERVRKAKKAALDAATIAFLRQRIEGGSGDAAYELARRYEQGNGVEKDEAEAARLLKQAAKLGNTDAAKRLLGDAPPASPASEK